MAIADNFAAAVNGAIVGVANAARGSSGNSNGHNSAPRPVRPVVARGALPESIQANREPYLQGDWRKEPYIPRCPSLLVCVSRRSSVEHSEVSP